MAANMKAVKLRIKSVESTMQITKAMELVASSKLRKAKERADTCRPYFQELYRTLQDIAKGNTEFYSIYAKEANELYPKIDSSPLMNIIKQRKQKVKNGVTFKETFKRKFHI